MRYLGIDYGSGKVGLAVSDEAGTMGFPRETLTNDGKLAERVRALIATENIGTVVIGESRDFSGKDNPIAEAARAFGTRLQAESGVPVVYEMEMFTTQEARRGPEGERTHGAVDAAAAALILTSYLSRSHD